MMMDVLTHGSRVRIEYQARRQESMIRTELVGLGLAVSLIIVVVAIAISDISSLSNPD